MKRKMISYYNDLVFSPSEAFLHKDFGQVPYVLSEIYNIDLEYWISAKNIDNNFNLFRGKIVRQFKKMLKFLPNKLDIFKNISLYWYFYKNKNISHLLIFPFTPVSDVALAMIARFFNPDIKIILKLDTNKDFLRSIEVEWSKKMPLWKAVFRQYFYYRKLLDISNLIICETTDCENFLHLKFMELNLSSRLVKTFSGLSQRWMSSIGVVSSKDTNRRNSIIVSGRISSWMKHTSLIFEAGPPPQGWRIEFVGEIDEELENVIRLHRGNCPDFDDYYVFHGLVVDKAAYYDILTTARVLLMNSRGFEGFPNVFAEAHFCRLFILSSDVSGARDATHDGRWGITYPVGSTRGLRSAFDALAERVADFDAQTDTDYEIYRQNFIWENSLNQPPFRDVFE